MDNFRTLAKRRIIKPFGSIDKLRPNLLRYALQIRYPQLIFELQNNSLDCFATLKPFGVRFSLRLRQIKKTPNWVFFLFGGDEENRTPVRKFIHKRLSERSLRLTFPHIKVRKQALMIGSFIVHGSLKALTAHVHHWMTLLSRPWSFR